MLSHLLRLGAIHGRLTYEELRCAWPSQRPTPPPHLQRPGVRFNSWLDKRVPRRSNEGSPSPAMEVMPGYPAVIRPVAPTSSRGCSRGERVPQPCSVSRRPLELPLATTGLTPGTPPPWLASPCRADLMPRAPQPVRVAVPPTRDDPGAHQQLSAGAPAGGPTSTRSGGTHLADTTGADPRCTRRALYGRRDRLGHGPRGPRCGTA